MKKLILLDNSQKELLKIIRDGSYKSMDTDSIMGKLGVDYPQAITNKIKQLENKGYIRRDSNGEFYALKDPIEDVYYFPLIGFAQCGNLGTTDITEINYTDTLAFSTKELDITSSNDLVNYFFTRAKGESMLPIVKEDDLVLIKIQKDYVSPADNTLVIHNGRPKIKRVFHNEKDGTYTLISLNPQFPEMEVSKADDELDIIGVVKKVISSH